MLDAIGAKEKPRRREPTGRNGLVGLVTRERGEKQKEGKQEAES
jgi:hypothetical protein